MSHVVPNHKAEKQQQQQQQLPETLTRKCFGNGMAYCICTGRFSKAYERKFSTRKRYFRICWCVVSLSWPWFTSIDKKSNPTYPTDMK